MKALKTILIVDDIDMNRNLLKNILIDEYDILEAKNGKEAIKILEKNRDRIMTVLLDIIMPVMNGYEFLEYRKHDLELMAVPVIVITESSDPDCEIKVLNLGASDIMHKPFDPRIVMVRVKNMCMKYELDEVRIENQYAGDLKETTLKLDTIIDNVMCGISILEKEKNRLRLTFANKKHIEMFNIQTSIEHADLIKNIVPEDLLVFFEMINNASKTLDTFESTYRYSINEKVYFFRTRCRKLETNKDEPERFMCITTDETQYTNVIAELEDSLKKMDAIFDSINGGIIFVEIGDELEIQFANKGLYKILGYNHGEKNIVHKIISHETYLDAIRQLKECKIGDNWTYNVCINTKDFKKKNIYINGKIVDTSERANPVLVAILIDLTNERKSEEKLKYLSEYDEISNVFTQKKFVEVTESMLVKRTDVEHVLVMLDIFHFRNIKTIFGKKISDELLNIIGKGLKEILKTGTKCRVENDVFAFCVPNENFELEKFANEFDEYIKAHYSINNVRIYYAAYIINDPYLPIDTVLFRTSYAMQEIKGNLFKNCIYVDSEIRKRAIISDEIQSEMFDSLDRKEFEVFLQPVYNLKTRTIEAAEALVRWNHPKKGYLLPNKFIPLFEENGFIVVLDNYVWNEVAKLIRKWMDSSLMVIPVSINVSRVDLYNKNFYDTITEIVEKNNIPPKYLRLEITESAYIINETIIEDTIKRLKEYGFTILMDDFGSGYSSLNTLKNINFDVLKIDMKLIKDIETNKKSASILKSIIDMANSLQLPIIAEGVETENQAEFLTKFGCERAQGFLFDKALPTKELEKKINK